MTSRYIAIDWGSTNLRAWCYQDGVCVDSRQTTAGVTRLNGKTPKRCSMKSHKAGVKKPRRF